VGLVVVGAVFARDLFNVVLDFFNGFGRRSYSARSMAGQAGGVSAAGGRSCENSRWRAVRAPGPRPAGFGGAGASCFEARNDGLGDAADELELSDGQNQTDCRARRSVVANCVAYASLLFI
jgi:hypothetical protein